MTTTVTTKYKLNTVGIKQGSGISPLSYILFTADFAVTSNAIQHKVFADDHTFWTKPCRHSQFSYMKTELDKEYTRCTNLLNTLRSTLADDTCLLIHY